MKDMAKFFVVALFLSLIFSVGAVCAHENMSFEQSNTVEVPVGTVDVNPDINQENNDNDDENDPDSSNNIVGAGNENFIVKTEHNVSGNSFQDIQDAIDNADAGDTIYLMGGNYTGDGSYINIGKKLTIVGGFQSGDGKYATLDGKKLSSILYINAPEVTIQGIKFINGKSSEGGAVYWNGDKGNLVDCIFDFNSADSGGAVFWNDGNGNLTDCSFVSNSADLGGAVFWNDGNGNLADCSFVSNSADMGGAVFWNDGNGNLTGCIFDFNSADSGGAVFWNDGNGNLTDCGFVNNSALDGGAVSWRGNNGDVNGCNFVSNSAEGDGGAVNWQGNNGNLANCSFVNNSAMDGGAVNWRGNNGDVNGCSFDFNSAKDGGAIYVQMGCTLIDCIFTNNNATNNGGAVYCGTYADNSSLTGCNFVNNSASEGGAVYWGKYADKGSLTGCSFVNNSALSGGAVNWQGNNVKLNDCSFDFNSAKDGGAIYANNSCTLIDCILTNNNATNNGGAVYWNTNPIGITNCTFENNTAEYAGGANYFKVAASNVILTGNFNNNHAETRNGGANYFNDVVSNVILTGNFTNNIAYYDGGVNYFNGAVSNVILTGNFTNNHAKVSGGANLFNGAVTNVILTGNFNKNTAEWNGGANYFYNTVTNVTFTGNFTNNHVNYGAAKNYGGANNFNGAVTNVTFTGNFTNNSANHGGVNHFSNTVTNVTLIGNFTNNHVEWSGGVNTFRNTVTNVTLTGNFNNNAANRNGGVNNFENAVTNVKLTGNFNNNTASTGGANNFRSTVTNIALTGIFTNNCANNGNGGANAFWISVTNVTLTGSYINNTGNTVIYIGNSVSGNVIRDSIFINNAPIIVDKGNIAAIDNWFGNNVTNYDVEPDVGIDLDNWLFLNGTADPNPVSVADSSNIVFMLSRYDGKNVSSYDNSRLIPIKLDITSTLGSVNPNTVNLNESTTYTPNSGGDGRVTASFENVLCTIEIEIQKAEPDISIESYPSYVGENATVTIILPSDAGGNVTVTDADGNNYTKQVKDGVVDIEVPGLPAGENNITVTYSGDERYDKRSVNATVQVDKMPTFLTADILEKYQGDDDRFAVVMYDARENPVAGMTVRIHIVGKVYNCTTNESGVATLPINLKPGIYPVTVEFAGKGDYANATPVSSEVRVLTKVRIDKNKNLVKDYGDADKFTVRLLDEYGKPVAGEVVNLTVAGKTYHCKSNADGYASLAINLKPGTYDIVCEYAGYKTTNKITVKQVLSAYNRQYKKASSYQFTATLKHTNGNPITGKTVTFTFRGKTYTQNTNSKGEATITIKEALNIGKYNIAIKYLDSTITKTITIK